jgi:hypothetical protein
MTGDSDLAEDQGRGPKQKGHRRPGILLAFSRVVFKGEKLHTSAAVARGEIPLVKCLSKPQICTLSTYPWGTTGYSPRMSF